MGRLSRCALRQDGRRDLRPHSGAAGRQRPAGERRRGDAPDRRRRTGAGSRRSSIARAARRSASRRAWSSSQPARCAPPRILLRDRRDGGPRQPLRHGRPAFHEPQSDRDAGHRPAHARTTPSTRRRWRQRFLSVGRRRAARRSAMSSCSARSPAPILKSDLNWMPESAAAGDQPAQAVDFLIMSEDLPDPTSRVRVDGGSIVLEWRRSNMTAHHGLKRRMKAALPRGRLPDGADASLRPAHAVAPMRHDPDRRRSRDGAARSVRPRLRPSEPVRHRCVGVLVDLGGGQSVADIAAHGARGRRSISARRELGAA